MAEQPKFFDLGGQSETFSGSTFGDLTDLASKQGLHLHNLDEQPYGEDDEPHYVVVLLGAYIPGAAGSRDDMEEGEQFEHREVWVSIVPVSECLPGQILTREIYPDDPCFDELADLAQREALEFVS